MTSSNRVFRALVFAAATWTSAAGTASAQESQIASDLRREGEHIKESCSTFSFVAIGTCFYTLVTSYPLHIALGNLAPQNGFTFGAAFSERYTPNESWRLSWSADAVRAFGGSYRAGAYMKMVHTPATSGVVVRPPGTTGSTQAIAPREFTVIDIAAQTTSLERINFYGIGQDTVEAGLSSYGESQTFVGGTVTYPVPGGGFIRALRPALIGGIAGRFVEIRSGSAEDAPSIETIYGEADAPGLTEQSPFFELREGIRLRPSIANGWLRLNYLLSAQQFRTDRESRSSFNRWTVDLQHEIPIYRSVASTGPREFNSPNECAQTTGAPDCPPVQVSRNRQGTIGLRLLMTGSDATGDSAVPFYFQPTLGGSDLNSERLVAAYADYRFRAPNRLVLQETFEHSLWGPIGVFAMAEQGKVSETRGDLNFSDMATSTAVGFTVRAGGFPVIALSFAWGSEGNHTIANVNSFLLGGSPRPSLY